MVTGRRVTYRNKKHAILQTIWYTKILQGTFTEKKTFYLPLYNMTQENVIQHFQEKVHFMVQNICTTTMDSTHLCLQI
jgi:hypothetical protein